MEVYLERHTECNADKDCDRIADICIEIFIDGQPKKIYLCQPHADDILFELEELL